MAHKETYSDLTKIFSTLLQMDDLSLSAEMTANDIPGWDSLTHVRLILEVEKYYGIKFAVAELTRFENVGELVAMIDEKCDEKAEQ